MSLRKVAVILFNLGGPDGPDAVRPFLFNLFSDKRIIAAPAPVRLAIATLISTTRAPSARKNYALMGGGSPIVPETQAQLDALQARLAPTATHEFRVFMAMRYWKPFAKDAAAAALAWGANEAVLLPLYPQFSTTTTASARDAWAKVFPGPTRVACCYPTEAGVAQAHADAILAAWKLGGSPDKSRVLFSAHGLPQRVVNAGDPYQWQVEQTVAAVRALLPPDWDFRTCYQSRVGPLKWIGPSTVESLEEAGRDGVGVIVSPIAFVSEHIETLVELDVEYAEMAHELGLPFYLRAKAPGVADAFIDGLARVTRRAVDDTQGIASATGARLCPGAFGACPMHARKDAA
ncbi:MAG: ferrochelatase [Alphaproteobacteria bacterium]|nr:ferrochelatase [Alphaproteobacteria bacterium]